MLWWLTTLQLTNRNFKYGVPQGSPILFITYIAPIREIAERDNVEDQKYAYDEQLLLAFKLKDDDANAATI